MTKLHQPWNTTNVLKPQTSTKQTLNYSSLTDRNCGYTQNPLFMKRFFRNRKGMAEYLESCKPEVFMGDGGYRARMLNVVRLFGSDGDGDGDVLDESEGDLNPYNVGDGGDYLNSTSGNNDKLPKLKTKPRLMTRPMSAIALMNNTNTNMTASIKTNSSSKSNTSRNSVKRRPKTANVGSERINANNSSSITPLSKSMSRSNASRNSRPKSAVMIAKSNNSSSSTFEFDRRRPSSAIGVIYPHAMQSYNSNVNLTSSQQSTILSSTSNYNSTSNLTTSTPSSPSYLKLFLRKRQKILAEYRVKSMNETLLDLRLFLEGNFDYKWVQGFVFCYINDDEDGSDDDDDDGSVNSQSDGGREIKFSKEGDVQLSDFLEVGVVIKPIQNKAPIPDTISNNIQLTVSITKSKSTQNQNQNKKIKKKVKKKPYEAPLSGKFRKNLNSYREVRDPNEPTDRDKDKERDKYGGIIKTAKAFKSNFLKLKPVDEPDVKEANNEAGSIVIGQNYSYSLQHSLTPSSSHLQIPSQQSPTSPTPMDLYNAAKSRLLTTSILTTTRIHTASKSVLQSIVEKAALTIQTAYRRSCASSFVEKVLIKMRAAAVLQGIARRRSAIRIVTIKRESRRIDLIEKNRLEELSFLKEKSKFANAAAEVRDKVKIITQLNEYVNSKTQTVLRDRALSVADLNLIRDTVTPRVKDPIFSILTTIKNVYLPTSMSKPSSRSKQSKNGLKREASQVIMNIPQSNGSANAKKAWKGFVLPFDYIDGVSVSVYNDAEGMENERGANCDYRVCVTLNDGDDDVIVTGVINVRTNDDDEDDNTSLLTNDEYFKGIVKNLVLIKKTNATALATASTSEFVSYNVAYDDTNYYASALLNEYKDVEIEGSGDGDRFNCSIYKEQMAIILKTTNLDNDATTSQVIDTKYIKTIKNEVTLCAEIMSKMYYDDDKDEDDENGSVLVDFSMTYKEVKMHVQNALIDNIKYEVTLSRLSTNFKVSVKSLDDTLCPPKSTIMSKNVWTKSTNFTSLSNLNDFEVSELSELVISRLIVNTAGVSGTHKFVVKSVIVDFDYEFSQRLLLDNVYVNSDSDIGGIVLICSIHQQSSNLLVTAENSKNSKSCNTLTVLPDEYKLSGINPINDLREMREVNELCELVLDSLVLTRNTSAATNANDGNSNHKLALDSVNMSRRTLIKYATNTVTSIKSAKQYYDCKITVEKKITRTTHKSIFVELHLPKVVEETLLHVSYTSVLTGKRCVCVLNQRDWRKSGFGDFNHLGRSEVFELVCWVVKHVDFIPIENGDKLGVVESDDAVAVSGNNGSDGGDFVELNVRIGGIENVLLSVSRKVQNGGGPSVLLIEARTTDTASNESVNLQVSDSDIINSVETHGCLSILHRIHLIQQQLEATSNSHQPTMSNMRIEIDPKRKVSNTQEITLTGDGYRTPVHFKVSISQVSKTLQMNFECIGAVGSCECTLEATDWSNTGYGELCGLGFYEVGVLGDVIIECLSTNRLVVVQEKDHHHRQHQHQHQRQDEDEDVIKFTLKNTGGEFSRIFHELLVGGIGYASNVDHVRVHSSHAKGSVGSDYRFGRGGGCVGGREVLGISCPRFASASARTSVVHRGIGGLVARGRGETIDFG